MKPKNKIKRHLKKGIEELKKGNLGPAQKHCHAALLADPDSHGAYHLASAIAREAGDLPSALKYAKQAALMKPSVEYYFSLSTLLGDLDMKDDEAHILQAVIDLDPEHAPALLNLGLIFNDRGDTEKATELYTRAAGVVPDSIEPLTRMGSIEHQAGRFDEAMAYYRKALESAPEYEAQAWYHISNNKKFTKGDPDVAEMERVFRLTKDREHRQFICFALGRAYENIGWYDMAFEKFHEGNRIRRGSYQYKSIDDQKMLRGIAEHYSPEVLAGEYAHTEDDTPIFIIGMPRSGTTLTEQIISSHPEVEASGESKHLSRIATRGGVDSPDTTDLNMTKAMGCEYIKRQREGKSGAKHITDKMPQNFFHVGLIKLAIPNAKIIHCVRRKEATCWSIYQTNFFREHKYACQLRELSNYWDEYDRLMDYWDEQLPGFIYNLSYESLVTDPEPEIRKLLEFCGLSFSQDCVDFQKNKRRVLTASASQVRQPMYKSAVDKWRNYEKYLSDAYGQVEK
jgi:tetratricopeptide (TPR) repeat protein